MAVPAKEPPSLQKVLETETVSLAFSGGGIRSASVCSGVLAGLLHSSSDPNKVPNIDVVSCVSGGGYIGSSFVDWEAQEPATTPRREGLYQRYFNYVRSHSSYMCRWGMCTRECTGQCCAFAGFLSLRLLASAVLGIAPALPLCAALDYAFGESLRCDAPGDLRNTFPECSGSEDLGAGRELVGFVLALVLGAIAVLLVVMGMVLRKASSAAQAFVPFGCQRHHRRTYALGADMARIGALVCLLLCGMVTTAYVSAENESGAGDAVSGSLIIVLGGLSFISKFGAGTRNYLMLTVVVLLYGKILQYRVFRAGVLGVGYSEHAFQWLVFASWLVLLLTPVLQSNVNRLIHFYYRWRLQSSFYHPDGVGRFGCRGLPCLYHHCGGQQPRRMADLQGISPRYAANMTADLWRKSFTQPVDYEIVTLDADGVLLPAWPETGARQQSGGALNNPFAPALNPNANRPADKDPLVKRNPLGSEFLQNMPLSEAMALSAAAVDSSHAYNFGVADSLIRLTGLAMGAWHAAFGWKDWRAKSGSVRLVTIFFGLVYFGISLAAALQVALADRYLLTNVAVVVLVLLVMVAYALASASGLAYRGLLFRLFPIMGFLSQTTDLLAVSSRQIPSALHLGDGGWVENLGGLALFSERKRNIVMVNGAADLDRTVPLRVLLDMAMRHLNCTFLPAHPDLGMENILTDFAMNTNKRVLFFHVRYDGDSPDTPLGNVWFLGTTRSSLADNERFLGDIVAQRPELQKLYRGWFAKDFADPNDIRLIDTICYDCQPFGRGGGDNVDSDFVRCQRTCPISCTCANFLVPPEFPNHSTANQMFWGPSLFDAYHREGFLALEDALHGKFHEDMTPALTQQPQPFFSNQARTAVAGYAAPSTTTAAPVAAETVFPTVYQPRDGGAPNTDTAIPVSIPQMADV